MNYQKIILVGNATSDPQRRKSKKGDITFTSFGVATGDTKDRTTFFQIIAFGKLGIVSKKYVTKGRQILVEGRIEVGKNGHFNVIADRVQLGQKPSTSSNTSK